MSEQKLILGAPRDSYAPEQSMSGLTRSQELIVIECRQLGEFLVDKNRKYADSALNPKRIFSRADAIEQIKVRIDDKLSRIQSAQTDDDEDPELDLIGYLILLRVARRMHNDTDTTA